ncbi:hypothetical protein EVJ58_g7973 [Rhodofomes roseus]|uniref:Uncharacterized protein n=1 Tax=Rhodofomes roseus TaxID=34475 RepID=A0A4Y9Y298_9APHY|nr:hypothetical protein EVJ58_g7973 [Rhodofomes roseus]
MLGLRPKLARGKCMAAADALFVWLSASSAVQFLGWAHSPALSARLTEWQSSAL